MKPLSDLPTDTLLSWWAMAEPGDEYTYVVRQAYPLGYVLTQDQVRREVRKRLLERHLLPQDRPAKPHDYQSAKERIIAGWDKELV